MAFTLDIGEEVRAAVAAALPDLRRELIEAIRAAASDRFVGVVEAAEILGITPAALRKRVARGQIRVMRIGRSVRMRVSDLSRSSSRAQLDSSP